MLAENAKISEARVLLTGIALGECPRWHDGRLWFSDWMAREIIAVDEAGKSEVIVRGMETLPFSFDWLPDGRFLVIAGKKLFTRAEDGSLIAYADLTALSKHGWNELTVDGRGNAYANNVNFDFPGGEFRPGLIGLVTTGGRARQVADGVAFPNGMIVTPDNQTLILAESYGKKLTAFAIAADGSLSNRRVWADLGDGVPDGICLDAESAVWYADVPNKRCVRVREGGEVLATVSVDRGCFACMLGGADRRTLFIVANDWRGPDSLAGGTRTGQILTARAPSPAAGWPKV